MLVNDCRYYLEHGSICVLLGETIYRTRLMLIIIAPALAAPISKLPTLLCNNDLSILRNIIFFFVL